NHWLNHADDLHEAASTLDGLARQRLLSAGEAAREEGMRQIVKQFDNMAIKRTQAITAAGNAPGAGIPADLAEKVNVMRRVLDRGDLTPHEAQAVLEHMGTTPRDVGEQLGAYVESLQTLRPPPTSVPPLPQPGPTLIFK